MEDLLGLRPSLGPDVEPVTATLETLKVEGDQQEEWLGLTSTRGKLVGPVMFLAGVEGE